MPGSACRRLFRRLAPALVVFAPSGAVLYERAGETARTRGDTSALKALLAGAIDH